MNQNDGYLPKRKLSSGNTLFNQLSFIMNQLLGGVSVATLVSVEAVYGGGTSPVGYVDISPLVNQLDGSGSSVPHTTIYGVPFFRLQGGVNAVICDPQVGDVGFCIFADRDISAVKASGGRANPGSDRRFDMADALYVGGWLSTVSPTRYLIISDTGIKIVAPETVEVDAPLKVTGNVEIDGTLHVKGAVTGDQTAAFTGDVTGEGTSLHLHVHPGVQPGTGTTGSPL